MSGEAAAAATDAAIATIEDYLRSQGADFGDERIEEGGGSAEQRLRDAARSGSNPGPYVRPGPLVREGEQLGSSVVNRIRGLGRQVTQGAAFQTGQQLVEDGIKKYKDAKDHPFLGPILERKERQIHEKVQKTLGHIEDRFDRWVGFKHDVPAPTQRRGGTRPPAQTGGGAAQPAQTGGGAAQPQTPPRGVTFDPTPPRTVTFDPDIAGTITPPPKKGTKRQRSSSLQDSPARPIRLFPNAGEVTPAAPITPGPQMTHGGTMLPPRTPGGTLVQGSNYYAPQFAGASGFTGTPAYNYGFARAPRKSSRRRKKPTVRTRKPKKRVPA